MNATTNVTTVESTTLASVAYDDVRETLQPEFRSGTIYRYFGVPLSVCEGLLSAPSKGRYFNGVIRGRFRYALSAQTRRGGV